MRVVDLINEQDQKKNHTIEFILWPQKWGAYNLLDLFDWEIHPFQPDQIENIPREPGIYSFVIQPGIASHPYCSYLMYIGKTKRTLRVRFCEYLREQDDEAGRPNILRLLNKYQGYLHFCCSTIDEKERIGEIEDELIKAFLPPCNDRLPAGVHRVIGAF